MLRIALIAVCAAVLCIGVWLSLGVCIIACFANHPRMHGRLGSTPGVFGAPFEEVMFRALDGGIGLSGWFIPPKVAESGGGAAHGLVVLCHGMFTNRCEMLPWAEALWKHGFAVLMFDFRACGRSEGEHGTGGYHEAGDVRAAARYASQRVECRGLAIGVLGYSMGGTAAIMAAADDLSIRAVATHGAYATVERAILQRCRKHFGWFAPLVELTSRPIGRRWMPVPRSEVSAQGAAPGLSPRPLLILHGEHDTLVLPSDAADIYAAAGEPRTLRFLPQSAHKYIHPDQRPVAETMVVEFFERYLAPDACCGPTGSTEARESGVSQLT